MHHRKNKIQDVSKYFNGGSMKSKSLASLFLAGLLSTTFVACEDDDKDNDNNNNNTGSIAGIWQNTTAGLDEDTYEFLEDGTFTNVYADLEYEECDVYAGTWTSDADSIYFDYSPLFYFGHCWAANPNRS
jgi:hypothetical protein